MSALNEQKSCRAVAARESAANKPPVRVLQTPSSSSGNGKPAAAAPAKKDLKKSLKGVVVKKKTKPSLKSPSTEEAETTTKSPSEPKATSGLKAAGDAKFSRPVSETDATADNTATERQVKRRRVSESDS